MSDNTERSTTSGGDVIRAIESDDTASKVQAVDLLVARAGQELGVVSRRCPLVTQDARLWEDVIAALGRRQEAMDALVERRLRRRRAGAAMPGPVYAGGVYLDPATLPLSGWWRASFSGSPWTSTASGGLSGGRDITAVAGKIPGTGTSLNSLVVADFDGTDDQMTTTLTTGDFVTAGAWSSWVLFNADTADADFGAASRYLNPQFWTDGTSAFIAVGFSSAGIQVVQYDNNPGHKELQIACSTGGWHLLQARYSTAATLQLRLDGGAWSTTACGDLFDVAQTPVNFGTDYDGGTQFDGKIAEVAIAKVRFDDSIFEGVRSYINARYGLSL